MRLLKTHSHTSKRLSMEPGTREEKQLSRPYNKAKSSSQKPAACRRCGGGSRKALRQTNHRKGTIARRALVDIGRDTSANTREKLCEKPPAGHRHDGGVDEETTNTRDGRWQHLQPR